MSSNDLTSRINDAAVLLAVETNPLTELLKTNGISNDSTGVTVLEAKTTTIEDIVEILDGLEGEFPKLKIKTAAGILKGNSDKKSESAPVSETNAIAQELKNSRPIEQWHDDELLNRFADKREYEVEQELHKRAKQQHFIVLEHSDKGYEPGKEVIDLVKSLELLKNSRKRTNPSMIPVTGGVRPVYMITEFNIADRMTELCPICGKSLYQGYCDICQVNFSSISDDARAYMHLVVKQPNFSSASSVERTALYISASKGIVSIKGDWPSLSQKFDELKMTNNLPQLRVIASRPSTKIEDPFNNDGVRAVGNKKF